MESCLDRNPSFVISPNNQKSHQQQKCCEGKVSGVRFDTRTEGSAQLMEDSQTDVTTRIEARLKAVRQAYGKKKRSARLRQRR